MISPAVGSTAPDTHLMSVDLPAPFGPQQAVDLAGLHVQVDALEGADARVLLHQPADLEDGGHPTTIGRRWVWAITRPCSTLAGVPPHTGSSCSTDSTPSKPPS